MKKISLIVPCFNEEESIPYFYQEFLLLAKKMNKLKFELIFIDDGSEDETLKNIKNLSKKDKRINYISFSRNFGKEAAMLAGLKHATGDYIAIADADLQDPISLIEEMFLLIAKNDWDCIAIRRVSRKGEPPIRSFFARAFYKLINRMSDVEFIDGVRDFRLMNRAMVDAILLLEERKRFSKGIFSWVGFKTKYLEYENIKRERGETKWSFWKLFAYSIDGIISFSTAPLIIVSIIGIVFCIVSFCMMMFFIFQKLFVGIDVEGYAALVCIILLLGGIQLMGMGILGQYISKVFIEVKKRPAFIIKESNKGINKK